MAVYKNYNDRIILTPLTFMDRYGIRQRYFSQVISLVAYILLGIAYMHAVVTECKDGSHITVKHAFFIIILFLHNLIACTKKYIAVFQLRLCGIGAIYLFLNQLIQSIDTACISVHR